MTEKKSKVLTLEDIFGDDSLETRNWDCTWISQIKIPENFSFNQIQALKLMTETARGIDWCGEKIALLVNLEESAKNEVKAEQARAFLRATEKTAQGKSMEANADPIYLEKLAMLTRYKSYLELFKQKQQGLLHAHFAMKEIAKLSCNEFKTSNWDTTEDVYQDKKVQVNNDEKEEEASGLDM